MTAHANSDGRHAAIRRFRRRTSQNSGAHRPFLLAEEARHGPRRAGPTPARRSTPPRVSQPNRPGADPGVTFASAATMRLVPRTNEATGSISNPPARRRSMTMSASPAGPDRRRPRDREGASTHRVARAVRIDDTAPTPPRPPQRFPFRYGARQRSIGQRVSEVVRGRAGHGSSRDATGQPFTGCAPRSCSMSVSCRTKAAAQSPPNAEPCIAASIAGSRRASSSSRRRVCGVKGM